MRGPQIRRSVGASKLSRTGSIGLGAMVLALGELTQPGAGVPRMCRRETLSRRCETLITPMKRDASR